MNTCLSLEQKQDLLKRGFSRRTYMRVSIGTQEEVNDVTTALLKVTA